LKGHKSSILLATFFAALFLTSSAFSIASLGVGTILPVSHADGSPSITITSPVGNNVPPGEPITVTGSGFSTSDTSITLDFGDSCSGNGFTGLTCTASNPISLYPPATTCPVSGGNFNCTFIAPSVTSDNACSASAGCASTSIPSGGCVYSYNENTVPEPTICTVTAVGNTGDYAGSNNLAIVPGVAIYPTSGPPGTLITVEGTGWVADFKNFFDTTAIINFENSAGDGMTVVDSNVPSQYQCVPAKDGQLDDYGACTFTAPGFEYGTYTISVNIYAEWSVPDNLPCLSFTGYAAGCSTSATFTLTPPSISVSPGMASAGSTIQVTGTNFATNDASGTIYINGEEVTSPSSCPFTETAYGNSFSCSATVPSGLVCQGNVAVTGTQFGDLAQASFTIPTSSSYDTCPLTLPSQVTVGSPVTVSGSGFSASDSSVELTLNAIPSQGGNSITSCPLTNDAFSCTFTAPSQSGPYSVYATGNVAADSAGPGEFNVAGEIGLSQTSGTVGSLVTITGAGFKEFSDSTVTLTFGSQSIPFVACEPSSSSCNPYGDLSTVCLVDIGIFSCQFMVPDVPGGSYTVTATGNSGDTQSASFQVNPSLSVSAYLSTPTPTATMLLSTSEAPAGTFVTVSGFGFTSSSTSVNLIFNGVDGESGFYTPAGGCPVIEGTFLCYFRVPSAPAGSYELEAQGVNFVVQPYGATGDAAYGIFTITSTATGIPATPQFPSGSVVTITGFGFSSSDTGSALTFSGRAFGPGSGCPTSNGAFSCAGTLPSLQPGSYSLRATGSSSDYATTFVALVPSLVLSPASGNPGTSVTITGTGYSFSDSSVTIYFGTFGETTCSVSSSSIVDCSVVFPLGGGTPPAGEYAVRAVGSGGSSDAGSASFGLTEVTILPIQGPPGTLVTLSGTGFSPYDTSLSAAAGTRGVGLNVGCSIVFGTIEDTIGGLTPSCTFRVPYVTPGLYSLTVTGSTGDIASAQLNITSNPVLYLSTYIGATGTVVTATGIGFGETDTSVQLSFDSTDVTPSAGCPITSGTFSCTFAVPGQFTEQSIPPSVYPNPPGNYIVEANGNSGDSANVFFTVSTSLSLSTVQGPIGTIVSVSGSGYSSSATSALLTFGGVSVGPTSGCQLSGGSIVEPCQFTVPVGLLSGGYSVTASDGAGDNTATQFTIVPSITLSPSKGSAFIPVTVTGTGFGSEGLGADSSVTITFSVDNGLGEPYPPSTTDVTPASGCPVSLGAFSCTFNVPSKYASPGTLFVVQASGNTGDVGSAEFSAANPLQIEPISQGPANVELTVSGSGYASDTSVALTFGGQTVTPTSGCPVFYGAFICSFIVPSEPFGNYAIVATGNSGDLSEANLYNINSTSYFGNPVTALLFSTTQGPIGGVVTVSGSGFSSLDTSVEYFGFSNFAGNVAGPLTPSGCTISGGSIVQPCTVTIPSAINSCRSCLAGPITQGSYLLEAYSQSDISYGYFVVTPSIALSSSSGLEGTTVTISGNGFSSSETSAQVWLDGQNVGPTLGCPVSSGTISSSTCSFVVPPIPNGPYNVYVIGPKDAVPASASFSVITSCNAGSYFSSGACILAPPGSFVPSPGATSPTACPIGTYQPDSGQTSCINAPAGSYVDSTGAISATLCAAGTYSDIEAQASCTPAPAGYYVGSTGATSATLCAAGTYSETTSAIACTPASPGYYVPSPGATSELICSAGTFTSSVGQSVCTSAPAGSYASGPGAVSSTLCQVGTYSANPGSSACTDAPPGSYVPSQGATFPTLCGLGTFQPLSAQVSCEKASAGFYVGSTGATSATSCAVGTFSDTSGQSACTPAPEGSYVASTGSVSATLCPVGYFTDSVGNSSCTPASLGYYVPLPGATLPLICAAGTFTSSPGQSVCTLAPPGSFILSSGAFYATPCPGGTYQPNTGAVSCIQAPEGSYVSAPPPGSTVGATSATLCEAGTYTDMLGQTECTPSPAGSYVSSQGAVASTLCSPGTYQSNTGQSSCISADPGYYVSSSGATQETQCSQYFTSNVGATSCYPIPVSLTLTLNPAAGSSAISPSNFFTVRYTSGGSPATIQATGTSTTFTADAGTQFTLSATTSGSGSSERWCITFSGENCDQTSFNIGIGGSTGDILTYYQQLFLTVATDPSGLSPSPTISPMSSSGYYDAGTSVTLTANTVPGYVFLNWQLDSTQGTPLVNTLLVAMNAPHTAIAQYETPTQSAQSLINTINSMNLPQGITQSLDAQVNAAVNALNRGNVRGAIQILDSIISELSGPQNNARALASAPFDPHGPGQIPPSDVQLIISELQSIINTLKSATTTTVACTPFTQQAGSSVQCMVNVTGDQPSGSVTFTSSSTTGSFGPGPQASACQLGSDHHDGSQSQNTQSCSLEYFDSSAGTFVVTASYSGDYADYPSSGTAQVTFVAAATQTTVFCQPEQLQEGQATICTATVSEGTGAPTGTISWTTNSTSGLFTPTSASCTLASNPRQGHGSGQQNAVSCTIQYTDSSAIPVKITGTYSGDANNLVSAGSDSVVFSPPQPTTLALTCDTTIVNSKTTCTANVQASKNSNGQLSGTVSFSSSGAGSFGTVKCGPSNGNHGNGNSIRTQDPGRGGDNLQCSVAYTPSASGSQTIAGSYSGDTYNSGSSGQFALIVNPVPPATTSVECDQSVHSSGSWTCTATVNGVNPTGTIAFTVSDGSLSATSCTLTGPRYSCSVTFTDASTIGTVTITAAYSGDQNNGASSASTTINLQPPNH